MAAPASGYESGTRRRARPTEEVQALRTVSLGLTPRLQKMAVIALIWGDLA